MLIGLSLKENYENTLIEENVYFLTSTSSVFDLNRKALDFEHRNSKI